jgi:putative transposase
MKSGSSHTQYWTGGHTTSRLRYHIVFTPKYRRRVLEGGLAKRLDELLHQACEVHRWLILELSIQPDHVHLMIQVWPKESVSDVVQILKGGSSRVIRKEYPELEEFIWSASLWADGYFAETVGHVDETVVRRYIRNQ